MVRTWHSATDRDDPGRPGDTRPRSPVPVGRGRDPCDPRDDHSESHDRRRVALQTLQREACLPCLSTPFLWRLQSVWRAYCPSFEIGRGGASLPDSVKAGGGRYPPATLNWPGLVVSPGR
jgi:hypothetical protein